MDLSQLEQIVAVADRGTISAAAEATHVSQPTLSRSMRQLEAELGCGLFERTRNRARLNDAGRVVVEHARAILAERQRMSDDLDELARRLRTLRVASVAPAASWRLTSALVAADPAAIVEPELVGELEAERRLLDGSCDLALTLHPAHVPGVRSAPLCSLFFPSKTRLLRTPVSSFRRKRDLSELAHFLSVEDGSPQNSRFLSPSKAESSGTCGCIIPSRPEPPAAPARLTPEGWLPGAAAAPTAKGPTRERSGGRGAQANKGRACIRKQAPKGLREFGRGGRI